MSETTATKFEHAGVVNRAKWIGLKPKKKDYNFGDCEKRGFGHIVWLKGPPFYAPRRGVLTHRVRFILTHLHRGADGEWTETHHSVSYLCGNQNCFHTGDEPALCTDPPADRFLCDACERRAERQKLPSGDKLAGRHVHRAILVPQQTCCGGKR